MFGDGTLASELRTLEARYRDTGTRTTCSTDVVAAVRSRYDLTEEEHEPVLA